MNQLRVALLGSPQLERGTKPVAFDTRKATALLAYLAVTGHPHSRETLAGLLWPDHAEAQARGALRRTLSVLNSATGGDVVVADRSVVGLRGERLWLDVAEFDEHATQQEHGHPADGSCPRCVTELEAAAAIYRDDFMAGFALRDSPGFDDWQAFQANGLRQQLAGVLERLARARVRTGELDNAIEAARRWLTLDPLHEPAHAMLIRLYAWTGHRSAAMRQYRDCVRVLHRELGVPPLSQTTALDEAVRTGRLKPPRSADQPPGRLGRSAAAPSVADEPRPRLPLVGRTREMSILEGARAAAGEAGRLVVVSGEMGIGKSRLLDELATSAGTSGGRVATTRCHEGEEGLAFGVVADLLRTVLGADAGTFAQLPPDWQREVARLVPELAPIRGVPEPPPLDSPGAQSRFYAALVDTMSWALGRDSRGPAAGSAVLAVEDVQWCDDSSAEVLAYLLRRLREVRLLLVLSWRPDLVSRRSALNVALPSALRDGVATVVELGPLDQDAVATLAAAALPAPEPTGAAIGRLWRETGGLPLLLVEYLEAFRRDGRVLGDEEWQLPGGVRHLLQVRLGGLSEMTLQVLAAAAVLNSDIEPALLRATSGRGEEEVVAALEEALDRAVVVEANGSGASYEFGHDAMRRLVYDTTSLARRRLLHSRAADALSRRSDADAGAASVAAHLRKAGRDSESADWYWRAAVRARGLYAHSEALEHLRAAAALGYAGHLVHQFSGDVLTVLGRYRDALLAYEQAAATCPVEDSQSLATLEHRLADVHHRLGAWDVADSHLAAALDLLGTEGDPALLARVLADLALIAHRRGDATAAASAAERALESAAEADDDAALAQVHDVLGVLASQRGDFALAERHLRGEPRSRSPAGRPRLPGRDPQQPVLAGGGGRPAGRGCRGRPRGPAAGPRAWRPPPRRGLAHEPRRPPARDRGGRGVARPPDRGGPTLRGGRRRGAAPAGDLEARALVGRADRGMPHRARVPSSPCGRTRPVASRHPIARTTNAAA